MIQNSRIKILDEIIADHESYIGSINDLFVKGLCPQNKVLKDVGTLNTGTQPTGTQPDTLPSDVIYLLNEWASYTLRRIIFTLIYNCYYCIKSQDIYSKREIAFDNILEILNFVKDPKSVNRERRGGRGRGDIPKRQSRLLILNEGLKII